jgi:hypothetical protein
MVGLYNSFSYSFNNRLCTIRQYIQATNDGRRLSHWLASVAAVAAIAVPAPGAAILEKSGITSDGILGHQCNKKLDSTLLLHAIHSPFYLRIFKNQTLIWF